MLAILKRAIAPLAITVAAASTPALAASPLGVWMDHTGRGAVEITDCNGKLCGRLVWFKDQSNNKEGCNFQIIGDVRPVGTNKWDGGWIVDPEKDPDKKYDVEITLLSDQKLKVMGYAGIKFLSETMMWTRAKPDLQKCSTDQAKAPDPAPGPAPAQSPPAASSNPAPSPAPAPAAEETRPERGERTARAAKKDCKLDLQFAVVTFPCPE